MLRFLVTAHILLACLSSHVFAERPDLPDPPDGFAWQWCDGIGMGFLRPNGWHFKQSMEKETHGVFITKENIDKENEFKTGLTVNVVSNTRKTTGSMPSAHAIALMKTAATTKETVLVEPPSQQGRIMKFIYRLKDDKTIVHALFLTDDREDKLYLILFESPIGEWDEAWKTGSVIMSKLVLDIPD